MASCLPWRTRQPLCCWNPYQQHVNQSSRATHVAQYMRFLVNVREHTDYESLRRELVEHIPARMHLRNILERAQASTAGVGSMTQAEIPPAGGWEWQS